MTRRIYIVDDHPRVLETAVAIVGGLMPEAALGANQGLVFGR
jgi:hypothetical protein